MVFGKIARAIKKGIQAGIRALLKTIAIPLRPIIDPIERVLEILKVFKVIIDNFLYIVDLIQDALKYIFNPLTIFTDILIGIKKSVELTINFIFDKFFGFNIKYNTINTNTNNTNTNTNNNKYYYISQKLIEILLLILCPPMIILNKKGFSGILHFIIATLLTLYYYIPGLIYSTFFLL